MRIEKVKIKDLNIATYNPRIDLQPGDSDYEKLKQSVTDFGYIDPIVWNKRTGNVVGGHQRLKVLTEMGYTSVECSVVDLSETDEKRLNLALNKVSGEWDDEKLAALLEELTQIDGDLYITGFDDSEITEILDRFAVEETSDDDFDVDVAIDEVAETITQKGDIWLLGKHRLICGDVTHKECLDKLMNKEIADMLLTDPPYNVDYDGSPKSMREKIANDNMDDEEYSKFISNSLSNVSRHLKNGGAFYIWHADKERVIIELAMRDVGMIPRQNLVWIKNHFALGRQDYQWQHEPCLYGLYGWKTGAVHYFTDDRTQSTVIEVNKPNASKDHPTMKPVELFGKLIANSSRRGEIVLDVFAGSGTTIIACEQLGRAARCVELSEKYCDVIAKRYTEFTGDKSKLLRNGSVKEIDFE